MPFNLLVIRYEPARLTMVVIPKCGSTTLISTFLILAGLGDKARAPRQFRRSEGSTALMAAHGLTMEAMPLPALIALHETHPEDRLVTVMRDPAQRFLSGYFSKINRFAKRYAKPVYLWGKLCQAFEGPRAWGDVNRGNRHMLAHISFERFLRGFEEHGTEWDSHFASQARMIGLGRLRYDRIFALERLDSELIPALAEFGVPAEALARLEALPRMNRTSRAGDGREALLTPEIRARIAKLYTDDHVALGGAA